MPVKPFTAAMVKATPGAVPPGTTVVLPLHGVKAKSGLVDETTSVVM